jgi:hypothetical protein
MSYTNNVGNADDYVDIDRLEADMQLPQTAQPHRTPLPSMQGPSTTQGRPVRHYDAVQHTSLQVIGHAITKLTWAEAETMGTGVQVKMKEGVSVASAIQAWANDWEKFE